jgi:predicted nucleic acid-binding protein
MSPVHALDCFNDAKRRLSLVALDGADYLQAAESLASLNLGGPLIYDALLLQAARKVNAETIYTWNVRHFQRLAPDLAARIRTP